VENDGGKSKSESRDRLLIRVLVVFIIIITLFIGYRIISNPGQGSAEFKSNLKSFVKEAAQLDVMTGLGVNYSDFKDQFVNVKVAYLLLDHPWPASFKEEENNFAKAYSGWSLTLQLWEEEIESPYQFLLNIEQNRVLASKIGDYLDDKNIVYVTSADELISQLMGVASSYYDSGKEGVENKLK